MYAFVTLFGISQYFHDAGDLYDHLDGFKKTMVFCFLRYPVLQRCNQLHCQKTVSEWTGSDIVTHGFCVYVRNTCGQNKAVNDRPVNSLYLQYMHFIYMQFIYLLFPTACSLF